MPLYSKGGESKDFKKVPPGTHMARCVTVVDCGHQKSVYNGEDKWQDKVWIAFEVPGERVTWTDKDDVEHEGPMIIGNMYTNSIWDRAALGQHLTSWRGKPFTKEEEKGAFDLFTILDKPCQISVTHKENNGKTYANITGIMGIPNGVQPMERETPLLSYTPGDPEASQNFDKLPKWLQDKCTFGHRLDQQASTTGNQLADIPPPQNVGYSIPGGATGDGNFDDDIPF